MAGCPSTTPQPVARLALPVIQTREVEAGETVGYGNTWTAEITSTVATVSGGYADGHPAQPVERRDALGRRRPLPAGRPGLDGPDHRRCHPSRTRSRARSTCSARTRPSTTWPRSAGTIGYEMLTALGARYNRRYAGATGVSAARTVRRDRPRRRWPRWRAIGRMAIFAARSLSPPGPPAVLPARVPAGAAVRSAGSACPSSG